MGFFKSLLKTVSPSAAHHADKQQTKKNDALAARVYDLEQNPVLGNGLGAGGYAGMGGMHPALNQPAIQYPQLSALPYFGPQQGNGLGQGAMPFMRNSAMMNTLGPLMQPNYGLPMISPYAPGTPNGPPAQGQGGDLSFQP